jgi:SAM-dependent methyltransferase
LFARQLSFFIVQKQESLLTSDQDEGLLILRAMQDILGNAIADFHYNRSPGKLWVHDDHGPKVEMPVITYFRTKGNLPLLEEIALAECRGKVLDVGAGAGCHTLILQDKELDVTALEISPQAVAVMNDRGVKNIINQDVFAYDADRFDTLLLLMNGIGLAGTLDGLKALLARFRQLLRPGGQLLFDSSDVAYLYEEGLPQKGPYYGEITCCYEYKRKKTDWFTWLYIDPTTLQQLASETGWDYTLLFEDGDDQYLVRLTPQS